ncbi:MAG: hypothetical protein M3176_02365 [Chloroflexota bacterium]|nr:hypothetical protein [Chloroflexota bacterium]
MAERGKTRPPTTPAAPDRASDRPPERMVRHVFWLYPILSVVLLVVVAILAAVVGSPNWPRDTIAGVSTANPGGAILAFTQELAGTATSTANAQERGVGDPGQAFVLGPLRAAAPLVGPISLPNLPTLQAADVQQAITTYNAASPDQQRSWASHYEKALGTITPGGGNATSEGISSPDFTKVGTLTGDFGPVPVLVEAGVKLAQSGYLQQYLQAVDPGHSFHLTDIWLYDHPDLLNTAVDQGLTDDQWGMVKERGFAVGPWYLAVPSVFHVYLPRGATGRGFVLWNLLFAAILLFLVPLVPGVRDLPSSLKLYRFIYRYPTPGELEKPAFRERHSTTHGGAAGGGK